MTSLESTVQIPRSLRLPLRLERAEFLKLRKSRSVWIPLALLTVGAIVVMYTALELFHLSNSTKYGPAGGTDKFQIVLMLLGQLGGMIAVGLVGTAAGTLDLSSRTFRDLISSGRSRTRLYLARIPGGLALVLPFVAAAYALAAVLCATLAGGLAVPSTALFVKAGLWVLLSAGIVYVIALGLGSLVGSRAAAISILIAYLLPVQGILHNISALGSFRSGLLSVAMEGLSPLPPSDTGSLIIPTHATALLVLACWIVIFSGLGLWRTQRRDA
ncbi:MAG: ABC transporter permease [Gaiellaceae bacterium]|jgi:ABC-type transport system involved in multi-copper enzyme maturation permease subunit